MLGMRFKQSSFAALFAVALGVSAWAASPDAPLSPEARAAAPSSASLFPELPEEASDSRLPGRQLNFRGGGSAVGGAAAAGPGAAELPSARALEQLDRRRNWIYATQSSSSFELSAERALGVRSSSPEAGSEESEGWLAEFFNDRGPQRSQSRSIDDLFSTSLETSSAQSPIFGGVSTSPGLTGLNGNLGMAPYQAQPAEVSGSSLRGVTEGLNMREQGLSSVPDPVRELLGYPGGGDPLSPGFDPINLRTDTTRQALNPTAPERLADFDTAPKTVDALLERPIRGADSARPSILDNFNTRMMGGSSLAPAVLPPAEARAQDRPLDFGRFPTRKF